jgi:hypothetical protein
MKRIIICLSIFLSSCILSMEQRNLKIVNNSKKPVTIFYRKILPRHVLCKQEVIGNKDALTIPLPATNALRIRIAGYHDEKIYVPEYVTAIVIQSHEDRMVVSQGEKTLGVMKQK